MSKNRFKLNKKLKKHRNELLVTQKYGCYWCGKKLRLPTSGSRDNRVDNLATMDHVIPRTKGGIDKCGNFVVACRACNVKRGCKYVNPLTNEPLVLMTTNLLVPDFIRHSLQLRNFVLIDYHETPTF